MKNVILGLGLLSVVTACGSDSKSSSSPEAPAVVVATGEYSYIKGAKAIGKNSGASLTGGVEYVGMGKVILGADGQPITDYLVTTPYSPVFFGIVYPVGNGKLLLSHATYVKQEEAVEGVYGPQKYQFKNETLPSGEKASDCPYEYYLFDLASGSMGCALPVGYTGPYFGGYALVGKNGKVLDRNEDETKVILYDSSDRSIKVISNDIGYNVFLDNGLVQFENSVTDGVKTLQMDSIGLSTSSKVLAYGTDGEMHVIGSDLESTVFDNSEVQYASAVRDSGSSVVSLSNLSGTTLSTFDTESKTISSEVVLGEALNSAAFAGDFAFMTTTGGTYRMSHGLSLTASSPEKISDSTSMSYTVSGSVVTGEDNGQLFIINGSEFVPVAAGISDIQGI